MAGIYGSGEPVAPVLVNARCWSNGVHRFNNSRPSPTNNHCRHQVCFALLQAGADKVVQDRKGETAQHLAESRQRDKISVLLDGWRPIGLTATQTQKIKESRGEGPIRCENRMAAEYEEVESVKLV